MRFASLALGLAALAAAASDDKFDSEAVQADASAPTANLAVKITTSFPDSDVFGIKLVNGRTTTALVSLANDEPAAVSLQLLGGALWTPDNAPSGDPARIVRNLTSARFGAAALPAGARESFEYSFAQEMHPAALELKLVAIVAGADGAIYTMPAFDGPVEVVEAPQSLLDPKLVFLYLVLAGAFAGTAYFVYATWISTLFPAQPRRRAAAGTSSKPAGASKSAASVGAGTARSAEEIAAQATGARVYDESWIPSHNLKRPDAKRVRSGTPGGGVKVKKAV